MIRDDINKEYVEWLFDIVSRNRHSFGKLLTHLYDTNFRYIILRDQNRAEDGIDLRYRFAITNGYEDCVDWVLNSLYGPCSVLEMMVALAIRCEETIMDDAVIGDRTAQWFWGMVVNLGLGSMMDDRYDERYVTDVLDRFLDREYSADGKGGLFTIRYCDRDLRTVEIWYQLCWYLDSIA